MNKPLVSVCLPAYNHELYVEEMLNSIIDQDYPEKELLIINDGSSDSTHERIQEWIESNSSKIDIQYRNRENRGISATLNELLSMAKGSYIAGASSDDYLLPGSLSTRINYLLNHPEKKAVFGDFNVISDSGMLLHQSGIEGHYNGNKKLFLDSSSLKEEMLRRFCIAGPVLLFDRSIFEVINEFDESLMAEDWDMYIRLSAQDILGFVNIPVAAYRWHDLCTCRSKRNKQKLYAYEIRVLKKNMHYFKGEDRAHIEKRLTKAIRKERKYAFLNQLKYPFTQLINTNE